MGKVQAVKGLPGHSSREWEWVGATEDGAPRATGNPGSSGANGAWPSGLGPCPGCIWSRRTELSLLLSRPWTELQHQPAVGRHD